MSALAVLVDYAFRWLRGGGLLLAVPALAWEPVGLSPRVPNVRFDGESRPGSRSTAPQSAPATDSVPSALPDAFVRSPSVVAPASAHVDQRYGLRFETLASGAVRIPPRPQQASGSWWSNTPGERPDAPTSLARQDVIIVTAAHYSAPEDAAFEFLRRNLRKGDILLREVIPRGMSYAQYVQDYQRAVEVQRARHPENLRDLPTLQPAIGSAGGDGTDPRGVPIPEGVRVEGWDFGWDIADQKGYSIDAHAWQTGRELGGERLAQWLAIPRERLATLTEYTGLGLRRNDDLMRAIADAVPRARAEGGRVIVVAGPSHIEKDPRVLPSLASYRYTVRYLPNPDADAARETFYFFKDPLSGTFRSIGVMPPDAKAESNPFKCDVDFGRLTYPKK